MDKTNIILGFIALILLIVIISLSYNTILYPSYMSYKLSCGVPLTQEQNNSGIIAGTYSYNASSNTSSIYINNCLMPEEQTKTLKHELCHANQQQKGRLFACTFPLGVIANEMECYFVEKYT